tara:strand:+ start:6634 stop:6996 length:363 start_codon:yes stop_codon:yes gene_type:complete
MEMELAIDTAKITDATERPGGSERSDDLGHATTSAAILLLAGFVATLLGAIREYGVLASLRPIHFTVLLLFLTCFSIWSTCRSRRSVTMLLVNCGVLGVCMLFVVFFVFLAVAAPFPLQD